MSYTLWHCGVLIGETDFEETRERQKVGIFRPTPYGLELFPRISGFLSAASELRDEMRARGIDDTEQEKHVPDFLETTAGGQRLIDLGRAFIDLELRDPAGALTEFTSIAFSDLLELRALCAKLGTTHGIPDEEALPPDAPRYVVSITLGKRHPLLPVPLPPRVKDN